MAIGGLEAANAVSKLAGEGWFELNEMTAKLANMMAKGRGKPIGPRGYEMATSEEENFNFGHPADGGNLPTGGSVRTMLPTAFAKQTTHSVNLTGTSMKELAANSGSEMYVESWVDVNLNSTRKAAQKIENHLCYGSGTGQLAKISSGAASVTQTCSGSGADYAWTKHLRRGMKVDVVDPATGTKRNSSPLTIMASVGRFATTFTVNTSVTSTTGDIVVAAGGFNAAQTGLKKIIDDGTRASPFFQGVNRTDHPKYSGNLIDVSGTVTESFLRRMLGSKITEASGDLNRERFAILSHDSQWSIIASLGYPLKRYSGETQSLSLGFKTIDFEGIPWMTDKDCPQGDVYFPDFNVIWKFENTPWSWDETTGSIWKQVVGDTGYNFKDLFEAHYTQIVEYGSPEPHMLGVLYSCTPPVGYYV